MRLRGPGGPAGASHAPDARLLRRVHWQLVAWSGGVTLAILVGLGAILYSTVAGSLDSTGRNQLMDRATSIARIVSNAATNGRGGSGGTANGNGDGGGPPGGPPIGLAFGGQQSGTFAIVVDPTGSPESPSDFNVPDGLPDNGGISAARAGGVDVRNTTAGGIPVRVLSLAVTRPDGQWVIQVVGDRTAEQRTLSLLLAVLVLGGVAAIGLSVLAGSVYARRALQSIRESLRRQREFAADASHELRTPIAVIKSSLDMARRSSPSPSGEVAEIMDGIAAEANQLNRLVDDLLLLARADSGVVELDAKPMDLVDAAEDALGSIGALAHARGISVTLDPLPTPVVGDETRLRQVVVILVDNAIRHSPDGGSVTIRVRPSGRDGEIAVEDQGPGIRDEDLNRVFDRFWRSADGSGGTGLGLSIAAWIARQHGGTIRVENVAPHGARFAVTVPGAQPVYPRPR